jgi:putative transposase
MRGKLCKTALKNALEISTPEIFNTDQGSQYTSPRFVNILIAKGVQISMDGTGKFYDNIKIERFWSTIKQEALYGHSNNDYYEMNKRIENYIKYYNTERIHSSLNYQTLASVYFAKRLNI